MSKKPTLRSPGTRETKDLLKARPQQGWVELVQKYGNSFVYQGSLATCEPAVVQKLLMNRSHTRKRSAMYKLMARIIPGAPGVLFMDGKKWHQHVQAVMPVFTKAHADAQARTIHEIVKASVQQWPEGQPIHDLFQSIVEVGLRVVLKVGYGLDPDQELAARFGYELMDYKRQTMTATARLDEFGFSWDQLRRLPAFLRERREWGKQVDRLQGLVKQILEERQRDNYQGHDWISLMQKGGFPLVEVTDELNHIYGAFNAIDYAITCGLYELSRQPDWARRIRQELSHVLGNREYPMREDFDHLPDTIHFMKEVFRYYPVAIAVMRRTGEPLPVAGGEWPADQEVLILLQSMHHHPDYWHQPEVFNPDRWSQPMREPQAYIPFLTGPRQCIGRHLAELHFVVTLSAILRHAHIQVLDHDVPLRPYLIPRFAEPIPFQIHTLQPHAEPTVQ